MPISAIFKPFGSTRAGKLLGSFLVCVLFITSAHCVFAATGEITFDPSPDPRVTGYKLYYGTSANALNSVIDMGKSTTKVISGLEAGRVYYFAAAAYDAKGNESDLSEMLVSNIPGENVDTDKDGIFDDDEVNIYRTDPKKLDTDGDGIGDGEELIYWANRWNSDADGDGVINLIDFDSDGDGSSDGKEMQDGSDPGTNPANTIKIWMEAEDGSLKAPMQASSDARASSTRYVEAPNGSGNFESSTPGAGSAEYRFKIQTPGDYAVWGRVLAQNGTDDSFWVSMDGGGYTLWAAKQSNDWIWDKVRNGAVQDPVVYHLAAGEHTLVIKQREDGTRLDRILVTNAADYIPEGLGEENPVRIWVEAEEGTIHSPMEAVSDARASSGRYIEAPNGSGFYEFFTPGSGYAEYRFNVASPGDYVIWGRVLAQSGTDDSFWVSMDGGDYTLWVAKQSKDWIWDKVRNGAVQDPVVYHLGAGQHTLVIMQREDGARLDKILMTNDEAYVPEDMGEGENPPANIWMEAETGTIKAPMTAGSDGRASGGRYIEAPNGTGYFPLETAGAGSAEYRFNISNAGDYVIWGRVLALNGTDDSFWVSVDGGDYVLWAAKQSNDWVWDRVRNGQDPAVYHLGAGQHTLVIRQREDGARLDRILVTGDQKYVPDGSGDGSGQENPVGSGIRLEAEAGAIRAPMEAGSDARASSGRYIEALNGSGFFESGAPGAGYAEYEFTAPATGDYVIWGRVLAKNGTDDSFWVSMDGGSYTLWAARQSNDWIWDKVRNAGAQEPVVFHLNEGRHTLLVQQREDGARLDSIMITNDLQAVP